MRTIKARSLGAVYIYIYISRFLQKERFQTYQNIKYLLVKAYKKISLILHAKNKIGYIKGVYIKYNSNDMKKIKLLHDSLSFL